MNKPQNEFQNLVGQIRTQRGCGYDEAFNAASTLRPDLLSQRGPSPEDQRANERRRQRDQNRDDIAAAVKKKTDDGLPYDRAFQYVQRTRPELFGNPA